MGLGKKLVKESLLPSVLEDCDAETESDLLLLGGIGSRPPSRPRKVFSRGSVDHQTISRSDTSLHLSQTEPQVWVEDTRDALSGMRLNDSDQLGLSSKADLERETAMTSEQDYDTDLEVKDVKEPYDPTGQSLYKTACKVFGVVPVSYFLHHMHESELTMMHHGLGPQGTKALAVPLVTNTSILKLNLRDNWMEGTGGAALAEMLKENCYITDINLSQNRLGVVGGDAISEMLLENTTLIHVDLSTNNLGDNAAIDLAKAIVGNQKVQNLNLSHNGLGDLAGELLADAIAENTGLRTLNLSWNCIRGKGAVAVAKGIGANIFLRILDLSYNGFAKEGAAALGDALKVNNVLEELNISNNRIPPEGAIRFAMGLRLNKTIKLLNMSRNPIQSAGCYGVLKAIQGNTASTLESLDFSDIMVNKDFEDLYNSVKEIMPNLQVKHGGSSCLIKTSEDDKGKHQSDMDV